MNARRITVLIAAAVASVPLMAWGSAAGAQPAVGTTAAPTTPAVQTVPDPHATSPIRQPWRRGSLVRLGWVGGYRAVVDGSGRALYMFTPDRRGYSVCYGGCARTWPPAYGRARAGLGVHSWAFGRTMRADGSYQATYHGHPLYHYSGDWWPGTANGQGLDGTWYLIDAWGNAIGGRPMR